jgi:2-keto-4-pentenoate hydratase/2-oxohepta-3-ene-1,7-dioic acid hydratase in catechol pathway
MRLVAFAGSDGNPRPGLLHQDAVIDLTSVGSYQDTLAVIANGLDAATNIAKVAEASGQRAPLSEVKLLAPIARPPRIFCIGLNYRDHALESNMELPLVPTVFFKLVSAIVGPGAAIELPRLTQQPDYEAELAVVIGPGGKNIAAADWRKHVFGYTILNDVSARDVQLATSQWSLGKSFDTFAPLGPAIVSAAEVTDPHRLDIRLAVNGELLQSSNTQELIFPIPELIAYISSIAPLETGDIISTGTPAGVGLGRHPQRWLRPGDEVVIEISSLGRLRNPVRAAT